MGENYGRIEVNITETWGDYNVFSFSVGRSFPRYHLDCESCKLNNIEYAYYHIISKLFEVGLLPEGFKLLCCDCFYIQKKVGTTKCGDCGRLLDFSKNKDCITIFCSVCGITYFKETFKKVF